MWKRSTNQLPELVPADTLPAAVPVAEERHVAKSLQEWMREGEELYTSAMRDYQQMENEMSELENRLASKQAEVNQIAGIIGKSPVETNRRVAIGQLIEAPEQSSMSSSTATIARALSGRGLGR